MLGNGLSSNQERDVWPVIVASPWPLRGEILGVPSAGRRLFAIVERPDGFVDVLIKPSMPDGAVLALDTGALLRLAGLDVPNADASPRRRVQQLARKAMLSIAERERAAEVFRAAVHCLAVNCMAINEKGREWRLVGHAIR